MKYANRKDERRPGNQRKKIFEILFCSPRNPFLQDRLSRQIESCFRSGCLQDTGITPNKDQGLEFFERLDFAMR